MFSSIKSRTIKLYNFLFAHRKQSVLFVFLIIFGISVYLIGGGQIALAEGAIPGTFDPGFFTSAVTSMLLSGAALMIKLAVFCLSFIIEIAGYNGYLNSTAVQVGWVMVRDIANMFFVVVLLLVAFGTILGLEQYEWKKMLVKFFFAAILVNFSRVICGIMIDVAQVIMITFVNGIAATAGGNLINAFNLQDILKMSQTSDAKAISDNKEIFAAAVGATIFAALTLGIMLVFVFMLLSRLLMLWILIVLSPFAFVFSVIPQTEKYASQWWSEFGNHVIVGPVVVFFLWLSFAVVGNGQINTEISSKENNSAPQENMPGASASGQAASAGITAAMSFDKIANFAIAIGILLVGAKTSQALGTVGGSSMSKATDFAKKVAMVGSGVAAGMWLGKKAKDGGVGVAKLAGKGLYNATISNSVEQTKMWGQRQLEGYRSWRAAGPRPKLDADGKVIPGEFEKEEKGNIATRYLRGRQASLIASEKMLEKVKNQRTTREDLLKSRAGAEPNYLMQKMEGPDIRDLDRMEQGQLEAEKERSAAKTAQFKAIGREQILASDRFKKGKWQDQEMADKEAAKTGKPSSYRGSVADQIAAHKEESANNEARIKSLLAGSREKFVSGSKGKKIVSAKIQAEMSAKISDEASHLVEGGQKLEFMRDNAKGIRLLERQTKLAAEAKEEHALTEEVEKKAQAKFFTEDHDAAHMLEKQKKAELQSKVYAGTVAEKESDADMKVRSSDFGRDLTREINLSEQAKKAAESFVKELQDQDLQEEFRKAGEAIQLAVESDDPAAALDTLAENDVYVRSMKMAKKASHAAEVLGIVQKESEAAAETEYVDKGVRGYGTPSSALVSVAKKYGDDLNSLNNAALAKALMDNLSFIADQGGTDDISKRAALFGTVSKVTSEAYIDDTIGAMASEINRLYNPNEVAKMSDPEKAKIKKMEEVFAGELNLFRKNTDKDGKITGYTGISNAKNSAILQNYAITGGNVGMMRNHNKIEKAMAANANLSYAEAAEQELKGEAKSYLGQMKKMDTFFKEATSSFKNGALAAGHIQLGGHQMFDEKLGFHRMSTTAESEAIMQSEVRKRGSKAAYQYHSLGNMNTGNGVLENVDGTAFGNTIGKVTTHLEVKNVQDRTVDALMGYQPSVDSKLDNGYGMLGGEDVAKNFGSDKAFLRRVILPQLAKGPQAFALVAARKFGNVNLADAQNGSMKVMVGNIKADSLSQLIEAVQTELKGQLGEYADDLKSSLEKAKALEASRPKGGGGKKSAPSTSDDEDDSPSA